MKFYTPSQSKKYISKSKLHEFNFHVGRDKAYAYLELTPSQELYSHDQKTIEQAWEKITFPNKEKLKVHLFNLPYNYPETTNAVTFSHDDEKNSCILLLGRTVPIPYAMTQYLVAHEFGHSVQGIVAPTNVYKNPEAEKIWKEYLALRGFRKHRVNKRSTGGWDNRETEIFANDFRVFYSPFWQDWWPHNVVRPEKVKGLKEYFKKLEQAVSEL